MMDSKKNLFDAYMEPWPVVIDASLVRKVFKKSSVNFSEGTSCESFDELAYSQLAERTKELPLSFNSISIISSLEGFKNLTKLMLDNNRIKHIKNLDSLVHLEQLNLSFNRISVIEGLNNLYLLRELSLYQNMIEEIEGLDRCYMLECLSIGNNRIDSFSSNKHDYGQCLHLKKCKKLRSLNLGGNTICHDNHYKDVILGLVPWITFLDYNKVDKAAVSAATTYCSNLVALNKETESNCGVQTKVLMYPVNTMPFMSADFASMQKIFGSMHALWPDIAEILLESGAQPSVSLETEKGLKCKISTFCQGLESRLVSLEADFNDLDSAQNTSDSSLAYTRVENIDEMTVASVTNQRLIDFELESSITVCKAIANIKNKTFECCHYVEYQGMTFLADLANALGIVEIHDNCLDDFTGSQIVSPEENRSVIARILEFRQQMTEVIDHLKLQLAKREEAERSRNRKMLINMKGLSCK